MSVQGKGYNKDALTITVVSNSFSPLKIKLAKGTIFEHTDWVYKQNLCVSSNTMMTLAPKDKAMFKVNAYCMNVMCGCSNMEKMALTDFYIDDSVALENQGNHWN